ncbi:MAG: hypothetical protein GY714_26975 [Desulfobacterales bacterium]|nr:hypothetical protein [Desulfobacterales bacterium]MCP4159879.1 hypothetical protein [Deltaproteobacteria bacterium]
MMEKIISAFILLVIVILSCSTEDKENNISQNNDPIGVVKRNNRILGFDISTAESDNYNKTFIEVNELGADVIDLHFNWNMLETTRGNYSIFTDKFSYIDTYYGDTGVELTIGVIDTNEIFVPDYITNTSDFESMIEPFKDLLEMLEKNLPNMKIDVLSIGNEIDIYLGDNEDAWNSWITFYKEVSLYAKKLFPDTVIGTKATVYGALQYKEKIKQLSAHSGTSGIFLTYYPLNSDFTVKSPDIVSVEFKSIIENFYEEDSNKIYILECGYPSSSACNSSKEKQAEFVTEVFKVWDKYYNEIPMIIFAWHSELNQDSLEVYEDKYKINSPEFFGYLGSLGFYDIEGNKKDAWEKINFELDKRAW